MMTHADHIESWARAIQTDGTFRLGRADLDTLRAAYRGLADMKEAAVGGPNAYLWSTGVAMLTDAGIPAKSARSLIGKWKSVYGIGATIEALAKARAEPALVEAVSYIEGVLRSAAGSTRTGSPAWGAEARQRAHDEEASEIRRGHLARYSQMAPPPPGVLDQLNGGPVGRGRRHG